MAGMSKFSPKIMGCLCFLNQQKGVRHTIAFGTFQVADLGTALTADLNIQGNKITGSAVSLDSSGDITLDAGCADILISDVGTEIGRFTNSL